ncbi:hypothetical protein ACQCWA_11330 [Rossellomorea aquimaris]|uniref:hypothetical protein n=1 Tax=Bacillaceae TaxID=186817 RepID=UPI0011EC5368|nr:hypothetical protein [Bacillus sp. CH30_1T]KAA0561758.1 hypothetical protein F0342_18310 [Bacillus sp. CH30_1T]
MEKQMIEVLLDLQKDFKEFRGELKETKLDVKNISNDLKETQVDVRNIKETVKRIEASQTEDAIALLKVTKQNSESEFLYLNKRLTEIDKRVFNLENRVER